MNKFILFSARFSVTLPKNRVMVDKQIEQLETQVKELMQQNAENQDFPKLSDFDIDGNGQKDLYAVWADTHSSGGGVLVVLKRRERPLHRLGYRCGVVLAVLLVPVLAQETAGAQVEGVGSRTLCRCRAAFHKSLTSTVRSSWQ